MSSFTPGPWKTLAYGRIASEHPGHKSSVAHVWNSDGLGEANARLIAAAPELLEALERIKESEVFLGAIPQDMMNAAIAKARGEQ